MAVFKKSKGRVVFEKAKRFAQDSVKKKTKLGPGYYKSDSTKLLLMRKN